MSSSQRNVTFDIVKGIGILAVVLGHISNIPNIGIFNITYFIYSFHMPLFFLVSGYFFSPKPLLEYFKKDVYRLLTPYLVTSGILVLYGLARDFFGKTLSFPEYTEYWLTAAFWGRSGSLWSTINGNTFTIGAIWFILAMFICRQVFNYIYSSDEKKNLMIILIAIIATYVCFYVIYIPLDFLQGLSAMLFYYIGYLCNKYKLIKFKINPIIILLMLIIWIYCFLFNLIDMSACNYTNYFVDALGAISGTYFIYQLSKFIENETHLIRNCLAYLGRMSLLILCIHALDLNITPWDKILHSLFTYLNLQDSLYLPCLVICRYFVIITAAIILPKMKFIRSLFSIKSSIS